MAIAQKITADNWDNPLLVLSTQGRAGVPDGNIFIDTANDTIEIITVDELTQVDLGAGLEDNPLTSTDKIQALALYFFVLAEVEADPVLQGFRPMIDAVVNRMGRLTGATAFLNAVTLSTNATTTNLSDRDKIADSGFTEFLVDGNIQEVYHGPKSLNAISETTQPYYLLAASLSEADRQAAVPVDFANLGPINQVVRTFENAGADNLTSVLILCAREFGYTIGEADSVATGIPELGAISAGYGIGNDIVSEIDALSYADVWTVPIAPYSSLTFFRHAVGQTRVGFSSAGAGTTGDFTDEVQLASGTMSITELRAWLDALMLQDSDENANTATTGPFLPKRAEPLYTINGATGKLVTRAGIWVDPSKLTADAQQKITQTNDTGGLHSIPFNSGLIFTFSDSWLADTNPWFRLMYADGSGTNDFDTVDAVTVPDAFAVAIAGNDLDARLVGNTLTATYAYDVETAGGEVVAGVDQNCILQIGGTSGTRTRTVEVIISRSANISIDATTAAETN